MNSKLNEYVKSKFVQIAKDLMENPQGLKFKLEKAAEKLNKRGVSDAFGRYVDDLKCLIRITKAWVSRRYVKVSTQTILYTIVALVYFVTPTDFVPDFILGLGFVDDMAVLSWVLSLIKQDLEHFKKWEQDKQEKKNKSSKKEHAC